MVSVLVQTRRLHDMRGDGQPGILSQLILLSILLLVLGEQK